MLAGVLAALLCAACSPKERIGTSEDPRLQRSFFGNYRVCESITLGFGADGRFACQFNSTEFVGHFCDVAWGTYSAESTHVHLHVDRLNEDNLVYTSLPLSIADSILFTTSGDGLKLYWADGGEGVVSVLSPGSKITSFPTAGNKDDGFFFLTWALMGVLTILGPLALGVFLVWLVYWLIERFRK